MSKRGRSTGFVEQILAYGLVKTNLLLNDFQGDVAVQEVIATAIDDSHSPFANLRHHTITTEDLIDHKVLLPNSIRVLWEKKGNQIAKKNFARICVLTSTLPDQNLSQDFRLQINIEGSINVN
jgi:hypothetical protein